MGRRGTKITTFDSETGEIFNDIVTFGTQNGDGWVIVYRENFLNLAKNTTNPSILRVFISLMSKQEFEFGVRSTKKAIAEELGIERTAAWKAFKWLKDHGYIKERKTNGQTEFLLNPDVTTCGKNKKEKIRQWQSV